MPKIDMFELARKRSIKEKAMDQMRLDYLAGDTKWEIKQAFKRGDYGWECQEYTDKTFNAWWRELESDWGEELNAKKDIIKAQIYSKYNDIYKKALKKDNLKIAKETLDSIVKMTGVGQADTQVNIQNNGEISIDFGFDNDDK
jgi:hypothetical protein